MQPCAHLFQTGPWIPSPIACLQPLRGISGAVRLCTRPLNSNLRRRAPFFAGFRWRCDYICQWRCDREHGGPRGGQIDEGRTWFGGAPNFLAVFESLRIMGPGLGKGPSAAFFFLTVKKQNSPWQAIVLKSRFSFSRTRWAPCTRNRSKIGEPRLESGNGESVVVGGAGA